MPYGFRSLEELAPAGQRILIRADLNVPLSSGEPPTVQDDLRIQRLLPTLKTLLSMGSKKLIVLSHLGQPQGYDPKFSLAPVAKKIETLLAEPVAFCSACIGEQARHTIEVSPQRIIVMENLRFHPEEQAHKSPNQQLEFARQLAQLGERYVFDGFSVAHRQDASCVLLPYLFPSRSAAGLGVCEELSFFKDRLEKPKKPFMLILGGSKMSSKLTLLERFLPRIDQLIIVGAMAHTFLVAQGFNLGASLYEPSLLGQAQEILDKAAHLSIPVLLPSDVMISSDNQVQRIDLRQGLPPAAQALDIGPKTLQEIAGEMKKSKTIFWNGPAGLYEKPPFDQGTQQLARLMAASSATTIVGGGDSSAVVRALNLQAQLTFLSSGGGASIQWLEEGDLPALAALRDNA